MNSASETDCRLQHDLAVALDRHGAECLELEWRLGSHGPQGFQTGVPQTSFEHLVAALDGSKAWSAVTTSATTERIAADGSKKLVDSAEWIHKTRLGNYDFLPSVRVSLSTELVEPAAPDAGTSNAFSYQRFKERRSYKYRCWSLDLTKVVSTADIDCDTQSYEVEIELVEKEELFVRPLWNVVAWGHALAHDMLTMMTNAGGAHCS